MSKQHGQPKQNSRPAAKPGWLENVVTPWWMQMVVPMAMWRKKPIGQKKIYLTFDDGPTGQVTDQVLANLSQFGARATFFCIGQNVENDRKRVAVMADQGHLIGNHSYSHPNGWKTRTHDYVADVIRCQEVLTKTLGESPSYFRPPFGRLKLAQLLKLRRQFDVVLWDILSMDYRAELTGHDVAQNVTQNAKPGSIVLMHDSQLSAERTVEALPKILRYFSENGFEFCTLDQ